MADVKRQTLFPQKDGAGWLPALNICRDPENPSPRERGGDHLYGGSVAARSRPACLLGCLGSSGDAGRLYRSFEFKGKLVMVPVSVIVKNNFRSVCFVNTEDLRVG